MNWRGLVAFILAAGVVGFIITAEVLIAGTGRDTPLTSEEASAVTTVLGAVVGALAVYLGGVREDHPPRHRRRGEDAEPPPPEGPPP